MTDEEKGRSETIDQLASELELLGGPSIRQLQRELAEERARLDYLESRGSTGLFWVTFDPETQKSGWVRNFHCTRAFDTMQPTLRAAIDDARRAE